MNAQDSHTTAFVLKSMPFKERDVIVTLLCEKRGKLSAIARNGVQSRRFGGSLDLFVCSDFEVSPKSVRIAEALDENMIQLLSAQLKYESKTIRQNYEKLTHASILNEVLIKMLPSQKPASDVFKLYSNTLLALDEFKDTENEGSQGGLRFVNAFILKMAQWLGVQPALTRCLRCQKTINELEGPRAFAQVSEGGWTCNSCTLESTANSKSDPLSFATIIDAYQSMLNPIRKIEFQAATHEHQELLSYLVKHLYYFVPGFDKTPLTSIRFLESLRSPF